MKTLPALSNLSLEEKVGQMLCLGWGGPDSLLGLNAQARDCVTKFRAGSMIVMGRNVQPQTRPLPPIDAQAVRDMLTDLQASAPIPLLIGTDQEGGRVARFGSAPFTRMPPALSLGENGDISHTYEAARITGAELAAVGVNWNFAPVADVNSNPDNPVIGDRAFGPSPALVAENVVAQIKGYADGGVLSCAKHFPGHGDTALDSHVALPTVPFDLPTMEARELVPFRAAIAAQVPTIMTAHILFPAVDPSGLPATMSRAILTGLLRETLGFDGLIVTDCLEMKAVADRWGTARAAVLAAVAGADMLLVCHTLARQRETFDALLAAAHSGELPESRINDAVTRVLAAKARALQFTPPPLSVLDSIEITENTQTPTTLGAETPQ